MFVLGIATAILLGVAKLSRTSAFVISYPPQQQLQQQSLVHRYYAVPSIISSFSPSATFRRPASSLFAKRTKTGTPARAQDLFPIDNDDDEDEEEFMDEDDSSVGTSASSSGFYDIDYEDDPIMVGALEEEEVSQEAESAQGFERDQVDILEEREDRLYVDEFGVRRKIERCILIGVEDMSKKRLNIRDERNALYDRMQQQKRQPIGGGYGFYAPEDTLQSKQQQQQQDDKDVYFTLEESLTEMRELVKTAGMEIVGEVVQRMNEVNPRTYIGTGKVKEATALLEEKGCNTVVFDAELTPRQQKHLENAFNKKLIQNDFFGSEREIKVVDRTALILDIFAMHAKTREGKLQVDLALHEYRKPRLTRMWTHLERQSGAGGVGLRGPGESQLEIDKRLVRDRIISLKLKIDDVQKHRTMHRKSRQRLGLPLLSLVGYTNAGKSSLLNYLSKAGVLAESMLFATLDPTTRKVKLPGYRTHPEVLLTDTVGFIQKLPTHLVAAFRATLEEVKEADVLIHVIDVSNPSWEKQEKAVMAVLQDIGCQNKPIVRVLNKIDLLEPLVAERLRYECPMMKHTVAVSALYGEGLEDFVAVTEQALASLLVPFEAIIPYNKGEEMNALHAQGNIEVVDYREAGTYVKALVPAAIAERLARYSLATNPQQPTAGVAAAAAVPASSSTDNNMEDIDWVALGRGRH